MLALSWTLYLLFVAMVCIAATRSRRRGKRSSTVHRDRMQRRRGVWDIPGPVSVPFFGTKWLYLWRYDMNKIHEAYKDLFRRHGPIVLEVAGGLGGPVPVVNLRNKTDIEKVLRYPSKFPFRPPTAVVAYYRRSRPDRYASAGIVNEQGEHWHYLRTKLTPELTSTRTVTAFLPELNAICDDFIALLRSSRQPDGTVEQFEQYANRMGLETACTLMLGRRMGFLLERLSPIASSLAAAVKQLFLSQRDTYFGLPWWKYFPTEAYRRLADSEEVIYDIISDLVDDAMQDKQETCDTDGVKSVFVSILQTEGVDIRDKKSAIVDFIAAGIETLANTLTFVLYQLAKNPHSQIKIREEIQTDILNSDILANATYTKACITESFRICPTAFCLARILETDMELSGYSLTPGTIVICQTMLACQEESNFTQADKFLPERWLSKEIGTQNGRPEQAHGLVVPFGMGRRTCPGKRFVEQELQLIVAKMVREFNVEFAEELELQFEFLLAPKGPINIILKDKS